MDAQTPRRGLGALLQRTDLAPASPGSPEQFTVLMVQISSIRPNQYQPRKDFNEERLSELADSIKSKGLLQPLIVRPLMPNEAAGEVKYEIIAGERRWRASRKAGLDAIPVVVKPLYAPTDVIILSLIENIQRDDLNPMEEAEAYSRLSDSYGMTQDQIAAVVGKSRSTVANSLRLMELPDSAKDALRQGMISVGHAKLLLSVADPRVLMKVTDACLSDTLSVRELEAALAGGTLHDLGQVRRKQPKQPSQPKAPHVKELEKRLSEHLGTKVTITEGATKGRIVIEFYSVSDFDGVLAKLGVQ